MKQSSNAISMDVKMIRLTCASAGDKTESTVDNAAMPGPSELHVKHSTGTSILLMLAKLKSWIYSI